MLGWGVSATPTIYGHRMHGGIRTTPLDPMTLGSWPYQGTTSHAGVSLAHSPDVFRPDGSLTGTASRFMVRIDTSRR